MKMADYVALGAQAIADKAREMMESRTNAAVLESDKETEKAHDRITRLLQNGKVIWVGLYKCAVLLQILSATRCSMAVQVESKLTKALESAWFEPLNLRCDILVFQNVLLSNALVAGTPGCRRWGRWRGSSDTRATSCGWSARWGFIR
jgi:hypothetical protein